jgi:hypothetical protein
VPLTDLIAFETSKTKMKRLPAAKQKRLDALMARNNDGRLTASERLELRELVREAGEMALGNARVLAALTGRSNAANNEASD